ncbi:uncharacterized protein LOC107819892 [Nicotiana tabacum]|uniref:Uncharacterized protein LOC107819892 n=1 Tax=Nicotiana tabacum TaxID=4097 RepID=A0A1S4CK41_TOBAC|nr:PREDICTED: uncharacterized protein LOC107819892 [Nicotiana tabacum]
MAFTLLSISSCYCLRLSQFVVNGHRPITRQHTFSISQIVIHPNINQCRPFSRGARFILLSNAQSSGEYGGSEQLIEDLRVPQQWLEPSKALQESEWLRTALKKWLDDEYCPEETNVEISKVAANSFYRSLLENKTDIGEILLKMAGDLESISYQESFHGAFSSANAAVSLIIQRLEQN